MNSPTSNSLDKALWVAMDKAVQERNLATIFDLAKIIEARHCPEIETPIVDPPVKTESIKESYPPIDPDGDLNQYGWRNILLDQVLPQYLFSYLKNERESFTSHEFRLYIASTPIWQKQNHTTTSKNTPSCKLSNGLTLLVNEGFLTRPSKYWYKVTNKFNEYHANYQQTTMEFEQL